METRIIIEPIICNGRPIIKGTRITVQTILDFLDAGDTIDDILEDYGQLEREDILACLRYSSKVVNKHQDASILYDILSSFEGGIEREEISTEERNKI